MFDLSKRHHHSVCSFVSQVIMGDRASAERACKDPNPIIDGRKANVNLAILGAKPRGNLTQGKDRFCFILPNRLGSSVGNEERERENIFN